MYCSGGELNSLEIILWLTNVACFEFILKFRMDISEDWSKLHSEQRNLKM